MRWAGPSSEAWDYLLELNPDIALLQEVTSLRNDIAAHRSAVMLPTSGPAGEQYRFSTVVLAGPGACSSEPLRSDTGWVDDELARFPGNLISTRVRFADADLRVISVHPPWWPLDRARFAGLNTSAVKPARGVELYLAPRSVGGAPTQDVRAVDRRWRLQPVGNVRRVAEPPTRCRRLARPVDDIRLHRMSTCIARSGHAHIQEQDWRSGGSPDRPPIRFGSSGRAPAGMRYWLSGARIRRQPERSPADHRHLRLIDARHTDRAAE